MRKRGRMSVRYTEKRQAPTCGLHEVGMLARSEQRVRQLAQPQLEHARDVADVRGPLVRLEIHRVQIWCGGSACHQTTNRHAKRSTGGPRSTKGVTTESPDAPFPGGLNSCVLGEEHGYSRGAQSKAYLDQVEFSASSLYYASHRRDRCPDGPSRTSR